MVRIIVSVIFIMMNRMLGKLVANVYLVFFSLVEKNKHLT